ncbi:MAG TPA: hypothetical protein PKW05_09255 [Anaerolineae bacterium]|nr:hypothetical protein [Anaerolineae bacterium]
MSKSIPVVGFLILAVMALLVYGYAAYNAFMLQPVFGVVLALGVIGILFTLFNESKALSTAKAEALFSNKNIVTFLAVVAGAVLSHWMNIDLKLGLVVGSAVVGLVAAVLVPDYAAAAYSGSFVGMAGIKLLPGYPQLVMAGVVAGIVYVLTLAVFGGFGGKLGTIAASGCVITWLCISTEFVHPAVPKWDVGLLLVVTAVVATVATYWLNNTRKQGPVMASAVVGLLGGLLLPALHKDAGAMMAAVAICASFAGMSNTKRMPSWIPMAVVGVSVGLVYMFANPFIGGTGGKLGTMAFGSTMAVRGLMDLVAKFTGGKKA